MVSDIIKNTLFIGCGSFIGGGARYLVSIALNTVGKGFPWGTLVVNLVGCLAIGLIWGFFSKTSSEGNSWALFLMVGVCGGFTTFSTFSKEALVMLQTGNIMGLLAYIGISVIIGVALVAAGYYLVRL
jgi:CrcB protein